MDWISLTSETQLKEIDNQSFLPETKGILLFKHSTRCSISAMALNRLERNFHPSADFPVYLLDLLTYRDLSQAIATHYDIEHASPQILLIKGGKCVYTASHNEIDVSNFLTAFSS